MSNFFRVFPFLFLQCSLFNPFSGVGGYLVRSVTKSLCSSFGGTEFGCFVSLFVGCGLFGRL